MTTLGGSTAGILRRTGYWTLYIGKSTYASEIFPHRGSERTGCCVLQARKSYGAPIRGQFTTPAIKQCCIVLVHTKIQPVEKWLRHIVAMLSPIAVVVRQPAPMPHVQCFQPTSEAANLSSVSAEEHICRSYNDCEGFSKILLLYNPFVRTDLPAVCRLEQFLHTIQTGGTRYSRHTKSLGTRIKVRII